MEHKRIKLAKMNPEIVSRDIGDFLVKTILGANAKGGVIGLSGGVDSTTAAALAKRAFDNHNIAGAEKLFLAGYVLPSKTNSPKDAEDGVMVAEKLGIEYEVIDIEPIVEAYRRTNPEAFEKNYHKGNMMSRIRANVLSTKAATGNKIVLGTGNKDEDFGIGYYTLFGDGAVHISPIGNLPKRLVRQMAEYLGFEKLAYREPTAGLEPGQTDFKDLGYGYDAVELVLEGIQQGFKPKELCSHAQLIEIVEPQLKINKKLGSIEDVVDDILKRHYGMAVPKAEIVHPPIAPISLEYK